MTTSASGRDRSAKREGEAPPPPPPLATPALDSHCHLDLMKTDVGEVMAAAKAVGIQRVVQIGGDVKWCHPVAVGCRMRALGDHDHLIAQAALADPAPEGPFGIATAVDVGSIKGVAAQRENLVH